MYSIEFKDYDGSEIASVNIHATDKKEANTLAKSLKKALLYVLDEHYAWHEWSCPKFSKIIITQQ